MLGVALWCAACGFSKPPEKPKSTPAPPTVGTTRPKVQDLSQERDYTGTVESLNQVAVVPQMAGQLQSVTVSVGDAVRRGQLLGSIDDSQIQAQVAQARATLAAAQAGIQAATANLAAARDQVMVADQAVAQAEAVVLQAEAAVAKAETTVELTESNLARIRAVAAKDLVAQQIVDETAAEAKRSRADLRAARGQHKASLGALKQARLRTQASRDQMRAAQAQLATAESQATSQAAALKATEVRQQQTHMYSPIDGVVVSRPLDPGAYVSPSNAVPVLVLASLRNLRVGFQVSEADLALVRLGQKLDVTYDALPNVRDRGQVQRLAGGLNPSTRTMRVELKLERPHPGLRPGMLAKLRLHGPSRKVMTVPVEGVLSDGARQFAWVVGEDGVAKRQTVKLDRVAGELAILSSGLTEKDQIVVDGIDQVQEGKPVKAQDVTRDRSAREDR